MIRKSLTIKAMFSYALIMTIFLLLSMQKKWGIGEREYYIWSFGAEMVGAILTIFSLHKSNLLVDIGL